MTEIEKANEAEALLRTKLDDARVKADALDKRRTEIAFAAHTAGGKAKTELDGLNRDRATLTLEIETLEAAIAEAAKRVDDARREADREVEREKARRVRALAEANVSRGAKILAAAEALRDEIVRANADLETMRRLGAPLVSGRLVELGLTRAVSPFLREAGLDFDLIPPLQRHDIDKLISGYVDAASAWASKVLGDALIKTSEAA